MSRRWYRAALCAVFAAILYLPGLGRPALWEPDEGRYAEIGREMALSGDFVTPRDDWQAYFEKPPLVYWAEAASIEAFGANQFAVRLPAALFTVGEVAATALVADLMYGVVAGILGGVVLALSPLVFGFARFATLDPALAFFLVAGLGFFYTGARAPGFAGGAGRRYCVLASAMLALGTLAKGPVALALGGAVALVWILAEHRGRELRRFPFLSCIAIYAAITVPWFALAAHRNPGFLWYFFVHEHVLRFTESREHGWGFYFFVPVVIGGGWPWLFFAPLGIRETMRDGADRGARISALRFLLIWFAVIFVFFSIPRSKLGSYILPAMPPVAILAGYGIARLGEIAALSARKIIAAFAAINVAIALIAVAIVFGLGSAIADALGADAIAIVAVVAIGSIAVFVLSRRGVRPEIVTIGVAASMVAAMLIGLRMRSDAARFSTYRNLALTVRPYLGPGCILGSYRHYTQSFAFYTQHPVARVEYWGELNEFASDSHEDQAMFMIGKETKLREIWGSGRCFVLIADKHDVDALAHSLSPMPIVVGCEGKKLALFNGTLPEGVTAPDCPSPLR